MSTGWGKYPWRTMDGAELSAETVGHADAPSVNLYNLSLAATGVGDRVVVAGGAQHGRELLQPIEDVRRGQVTSVKDEVHASKELLWLGAKLVEMADYVWKMGVGEEADNHEGDYTSCGIVSLCEARTSERGQLGALVSRNPPSTGRTMPVTNLASSLAR